MTAGKATAAQFKRQQPVWVSYGCVQIMEAVGKFAAGGRVVDRTNWRKGWFGIELNSGALVTAHASALTALK